MWPFGKKKQQAKSAAGQATRQTSGTVQGKQVIDMRSEAEKLAAQQAKNPLSNATFEAYAQQIVDIFFEKLDFEACNEKLRAIGEKINDYDSMVLVSSRAEHLARQRNEPGVFSMRVLEYAWDRIAGWMY